jgi:MFS family permease
MDQSIREMASTVVSKPAGALVASTIGISVGVTSTVTAVFSLFLVPLATEFDVPRTSVSLVLALVAIANAITYPIMGRFADHYGARKVILCGTILFVFAMTFVSKVEGLLQLYIAYTLIGISGSALGPVLFSKIVSGWFDSNRGFSLGIIGGVGNGVGSAVMPLYVLMLISEYGWRDAYQGIAALIFFLAFPILFFFLRDPPMAASAVSDQCAGELSGLSFKEARQTSAFWLLLISIAVCSGCLLAVFTHVVPILTDRGVAMSDATAVLTTFALVTVASQVVVGLLLDKMGRPRLICLMLFMSVLGLGVLASATSVPMYMLSATLMGLSLGAEFGLLPYAISRYFGLKDFGQILGIIYSMVALASGFLPVLMDVVFDLTDSYNIAIFGAALGMLIGTVMIGLLPRFDSLVESRPGAISKVA